MVNKPLLIAKTGDTADSIREIHGDFDRWFAQHAGDVDVTVVEVHRAPERLPPPCDLAGLIITGSPHSVTEPEDWSLRLSDWTVDAINEGLPTLGVCYGHQIIGDAFGGVVKKNPVQYEIGTIDVELTEAGKQDELLGQLEPGATSLAFNAVHGDIVSTLPMDAVRLATNDVAVNQAYRFRDHVWAVQFHPEFSTEVMELYVRVRAEAVRQDARLRGVDPEAAVQAASESVRETPNGAKLIRAFVKRYVMNEK